MDVESSARIQKSLIFVRRRRRSHEEARRPQVGSASRRADKSPPTEIIIETDEWRCGEMSLAEEEEVAAVAAASGGLAELNVPYAACEALVAVCAILGNGLVILVFAKERKLRRRTNYYIISLACADLLVGLFAIPLAVLASIGLPRNLHACLFTVSVLVVLCTISIFCLVAVSVDRYWAILHPMGYSRTVRTKTAVGIICVCWLAGTLVGFLPLLGWNAGHKPDEKCIFTEVMDYDYLVFLYFATIIFPALLIAAFYAHIYRVVVKQLQQIVTMNPGCKRKENETHGTMLRLLGAAQKREVKATQNLSRIVVFFIICWFPLYTINCVEAFCPRCQVSEVLLNFCIILSHLNSAGNPLLYAYHLKDFRAALKSFIHGMLFPAAAATATNATPKVLGKRAQSPPSLLAEPPGTRRRDSAPKDPDTASGPQPNRLERPTPDDAALSGSGSGSGSGSSSSSSGSCNNSSRKSGSISIIANGNNNNDNLANKMGNRAKKRAPGASRPPVSNVGCKDRRDATSTSNGSSGSSGNGSRNVPEANGVTPKLELESYDDEDAVGREEGRDRTGATSSVSQPRPVLVIEADVNHLVSTKDVLGVVLPSGEHNLDQVPSQ